MVRGRLTKNQATTGPDNVWPEVWTRIGEVAQKREKQEWTNEKSKLDDGRRLSGIQLMWKARRNLEVHMDAAMLCNKVTEGPACFQETEAKHDAPTNFQKQSMLE